MELFESYTSYESRQLRCRVVRKKYLILLRESQTLIILSDSSVSNLLYHHAHRPSSPLQPIKSKTFPPPLLRQPITFHTLHMLTTQIRIVNRDRSPLHPPTCILWVVGPFFALRC